MRQWIVFGLLVTAGCITTPPPTEPAPKRFDCPTYPDGTAVDCDVSVLRTTGVAVSVPGPESGWLCVLRHRNDAGLGVFDFYVHQDGRIAYAWDLQIQRQGGFTVVQAGVYHGTTSQFLVAPYQPKGFAVFAQKKQGDTASVHLLARHIQLDEKHGQEWKPVVARPLVSEYKMDAWFLLEFDAGHGTEYLSPMHPAEAPRPYEPDDTHIQNETRELFIDVWVAGAKFQNANIGWPSTGNTRCML